MAVEEKDNRVSFDALLRVCFRAFHVKVDLLVVHLNPDFEFSLLIVVVFE